MENKVTIKIPRQLYERIQVLIENSGFHSPTDFIVYVLRDLVGETELKREEGDLTPKELATIRRRLKNLGYL